MKIFSTLFSLSTEWRDRKKLILIFRFFLGVTVLSTALTSVKASVIVSQDNTTALSFLELLKTCESAHNPIVVGAFKLNPGKMPSPSLLKAFAALTAKGATVQILLESRLTQEELSNTSETSYKNVLNAFEKTGAILLKDLAPYKNVHVKILLSDTFALVGTTNFDQEDLPVIKRDFSILLKDPLLLIEMREILKVIQQRHAVQWPQYSICEIKEGETRLSWGPGQHRTHLVDLIQSAQNSICLYQQDLQDPKINEALIRQIRKKVKISILMSKNPFGKNKKNKSLPQLRTLFEAGADIRLTGKKIVEQGKPLHIHAKVLIIDGRTPDQKMYVGSANFFPGVLDPQSLNLNLGIITRDARSIQPIHDAFCQDWKAHAEEKFKIL